MPEKQSASANASKTTLETFAAFILITVKPLPSSSVIGFTRPFYRAALGIAIISLAVRPQGQIAGIPPIWAGKISNAGTAKIIDDTPLKSPPYLI
jgi:hypothetical protein